MHRLSSSMNELSHSHRSRAASPSGPGGGQQFGYHTVLSALRCWWKIATPLGLLLAAISGAVTYFLSDPVYTAEVWLIIRERQDHLLDLISREDPKKFIANQIEMMRSPPIINPVAAIPAVANTPEIAREVDPGQAIKRQINISPKGQSEYFVVQFTSKDPQSAALIPNEIAKAYLELQRRTEGFRSNELIKLLNDELGQQQGVVEQARSAWYNEYKSALGIAPEEVQLHNQVAKLVTAPGIESALQTQLLNAEVELMLLDVQIRYLEAQPPGKPTPWELEQYIQNDPKILRLQAIRTQLEPKIQDHKKVSANPETNPLLRELEKQKKKGEEDLASAQEALRPQIEEELEKSAKSRHESELTRLRDRRAGLEILVKTINEKLKSQEVKSENQQEVRRDVKDKMFKVDLLKSDYERAQQRYDALKKRIDSMGLEQRAPSRVDVYEFAAVPKMPDSAAPFKKIGMAVAAAFFLPFGLAIGLEVLLRRIGSRQELEDAGEIAVVGEVTELPRSAQPARLKSNKANRELQLYEESIDGLRTYLTLVESLKGMRVLAVASAVSREGKTSLAAQLAVSLARATGERTLLVDGDIRSPDIHRIFDVEREPGLVEVLRGDKSIQESIQTSFSGTLHLLTAGQLRTSPHRLIGNGEFGRLVDNLKDMYRYVIIDTPPILSASEALVMAQAADATILCVRRDYSRAAQVKEAYSRLQATGVKTAGAVLNGIPSREYSSRYGNYYYSQSRADSDLEASDPA